MSEEFDSLYQSALYWSRDLEEAYIGDSTVKSQVVIDMYNALLASQAREAELREKMEAAEGRLWKVEAGLEFQTKALGKAEQRAEAAEARIKASQEQEPFKFCDTATGRVHDYAYDCEGNAKALYLEPIIPPELAELQRENAELTRKLAEQQAIQTKIANFLQNESGLDNLRDLAQAMLDCFKSDKEELRKLLESKVPEGWQLVPKHATVDMWMAGQDYSNTDGVLLPGFQIEQIYIAMLAAAPQPKEPKH